VGQHGEHTLAQELVLLATPPGRIRWPLLHLTTDNGLAGVELVSRKVDLGAIAQPIPIMVPDLRLTNIDLAEDQVPSEQVLDHQCRHSALTPGRVVRPPMLQVVRITGVRPPGSPQQRPQHLHAQHPKTIAWGYDSQADRPTADPEDPRPSGVTGHATVCLDHGAVALWDRRLTRSPRTDKQMRSSDRQLNEKPR
jgi:hypothetical protein